MRPKPPTCHGCPAFTVGRSYVPGEGPKDARVAVVGQGPGEQEAETGRPFVGRAGHKQRQWYERTGWSRDEVWTDNVVRCWLPGNREPKSAEVAHCTRVHLLPALRALPNLRLLIPMGTPAIRWVLGPQAGERDAGALRVVELGER